MHLTNIVVSKYVLPSMYFLNIIRTFEHGGLCIKFINLIAYLESRKKLIAYLDSRKKIKKVLQT